MPHGRYSLHDPDTRTPLGEEHFQCAPGPSGWRYTATRRGPDGNPTGALDLTIDDRGRQLRLEARSGPWQVRGGTLNGLSWVRTARTGSQPEPGDARAHAFTGSSPGFLIAVARLVRPAPGGDATRIRLVELTDPVLAPRTLDQSWQLVDSSNHHQDGATLTAHTYRVTDLQTGAAHPVHLTGDIVLAAPGVELEELDGPPSDYRTPP